MAGDRSCRIGRGARLRCLWGAVSAARRLQRRVLSRCEALEKGAEGDRSGDFALLGGWSAADIAAF